MALIDPSPFSTSIDDLLVHFRVHCSKIRAALLRRDRLWSSHSDSLLSDERKNKEAVAERIDTEHRLREQVHLLVDRIRISERDKSAKIQMAVDKEKKTSAERVASLELYWNAAIGRVKEERMIEEGVNMKRIGDLCSRVQVLESELRNKDADIDRVSEKKRAMEDGFLNRINEQGIERDIIIHQKVALERRKNTMEAEMNKKIGEFVCRISAADAETNKILKEKRASEEEKRVLVGRVETLKRDKRLMEAELLKMKSEKSPEVIKVTKEYAAIVEGVKEENCKLADKIEVLKRDNLALEAEVFRKKAAANCKLVSLEANIKRLKRTIKFFEREKADKDLQILQMRRVLENHKEEEVIKNGRNMQEMLALEIKYETLKKEKMVIQTHCKKLEKENRMKPSKMEARVHMQKKDNNSESVQNVEVTKALEIQNKALEKKKPILETQSKTLGKESRKKTWKTEARVHEQKKDENNESVQIVEATKALEIYNKVEEAEMEDSGLLERIMILEREKEEMVFNVLRMEVLDKEKSEVIQRIMIGKMAMESEKADYEKKNLELADGISNLECKNQRLEAVVLRMEALQREKSEVMQMILDGKIYMEDKKYEHEKKIMELTDGISILEREKQRLETEIMEKNEVIKVLYKENTLLEAEKKLQEVLASKLKEDVQPFKRLRPTDNSGSPSNWCLNEVQKSVAVVCSSEHHGSFNDSVENCDGKSEYGMSCTKAGKRKQLIRQCEEPGRKIPKRACDQLLTSPGDTSELVAMQQNMEMNSAGLTNESIGGDNVDARWEFDQDLLEAFDADPELCLRAVCDDKNVSIS